MGIGDFCADYFYVEKVAFYYKGVKNNFIRNVVERIITYQKSTVGQITLILPKQFLLGHS